MPDRTVTPSTLLNAFAGAPSPPRETPLWASLAWPAYRIDVHTYGRHALNAAARAATGPGRADGAPCYAVAHGRDRPCSHDGCRCPLEEAVFTRRPVQVQHVHTRPREKPRLQNVLAIPLLNAEGEIAHVMSCCWDLTAAEARAWAAARDGTLAQDLVAIAAPAAAQQAPELSEREADVLALVAEGLTNRAISRELRISVSTVKYHLGHLREKLDVRGRHELIAHAVRYELA